jgi:hypothetical protein
MKMGWGISVVHADPAGVKDPVHLPTGQFTPFYSKHHGDPLVKADAIGVPTYELPYRMGGVSPKKKVAAIDLAATAHETAIYVHAINRGGFPVVRQEVREPSVR